MIDVVLYGREQIQRDEVSSMLYAENFWIRQVENNQQFNQLNLDRYDLVIAIINSKSELLELNFLDFKQLPIIIIAGSEPSFILTEKYPRNLVDIITFAIEPDMLMRRIRNAILGLDFFEEKYIIPGPSGNLSEFKLLEIIQALMRRSATGQLRLEFSNLNAEIYFNEGEIIKAFCSPDFHNLEALDVMLLAEDGIFEFENVESLEGKPLFDMQHILFHLVEKLSQYESLMEELPQRDKKLTLNPKNVPVDEGIESIKPLLISGATINDLLFNTDVQNKKDLLVLLNKLWRQGNIVYNDAKTADVQEKRIGLFGKLFGKKQEEIPANMEEVEEELEKTEKSINFHLTKMQLEKLKKALGQD